MSDPKQNGNLIEEFIINLLEHEGYSVDYVDKGHDLEILDSITGINYLCEVKSCQRHIIDTHANAGYRLGRFNIPPGQHEYLIGIDGYYIFVVHDEGIMVHLNIVRAIDLTIAKHKSNIRYPDIFAYNTEKILLNKYQLTFIGVS